MSVNRTMEMDTAPYFPQSGRGYQPLHNAVDDTDLPPPYQPPPVQQQQQQNSSNVVLVGQPSVGHSVRVEQVARANDYMIVSLVFCILCTILGNWPVLTCLFPAVILSIIANTYKDAGEYNLARKFGSVACICNLMVLIFSVILMLLVVIGGITILFVSRIIVI